jgi:hypothetical protein
MERASVLEFHPTQPTAPSSGLAGLNLCNLHLALALSLDYTGLVLTHHARSALKGTKGAPSLVVLVEWRKEWEPLLTPKYCVAGGQMWPVREEEQAEDDWVSTAGKEEWEVDLKQVDAWMRKLVERVDCEE